MARLIILLFLISGSIFVAGQQREVDSLLRELSNHPQQDSTRIDILNDLAYAYHPIDPDKGLQSADEAMVLSRKHQYQKRLASSYSNKGVNYWAKGEDSLSGKMYQEALQIHQSLNNLKGMGTTYNNIGMLHFNQSDFYEAIRYHEMALNIYKELNDSLRIASILNNIGVDYQFVSDYAKALDRYLEALKIYTKKFSPDQYNIAVAQVFTNIGLIYKSQQQFDSALIFQNRALQVFERSGNKQGMAAVYGNIGVIYHLQSQSGKAVEILLKALRLNEASGNLNRMASDYINLGAAYIELKDFDKGYQYLVKARKIYQSTGDQNNLAIALMETGNLFRDAPKSFLIQHAIPFSKRYETALRFQKDALDIASGIGSISLQSQALENMSSIYEVIHDPAKALSTFKNHILLRDSVMNEEKRVSLAKKVAAFEFEKQTALRDAEYSKSAALSAAEIQRQRLQRNAITVGSALLLVAAFAGYLAYKRKRDAEINRKEVAFKMRVTETEMKALRAQMNPHFIFNSLNSISDYISRNDIQAADEYLIKFAQLMRLILDNSEQKEVTLSDDLRALELYMQLEAKRMNHKFEYNIHLADNIDPANTLVPPLLIQPFVENSIWHGIARSTEKGKIDINISCDNNVLTLIVDDNGVGRNFSPTDKSPQRPQKKSLGMKITRERIEIMNHLKQTHASVTLHDLSQGLRAELKLPLQTAF